MVTSAAEAASHARQGRGSSSRQRGAASSGEVQQGQTLPRARAAAWGVDGAWLDACEGLASQAIEVTAAQNTPATPSLRASAEVHARGVAMILLRRVLGAFAAGHAAHLAVPSIEPLYLRAVFAPKRAAKKGEGDASKGEASKNDASKGEGAPTEPKGSATEPKG